MTNYRKDIDALRALAVLEVLLYHLDFTWIPGGYVGVDVFFVISGYLISRLIADEIAQTGRFSFADFYIRRARRLFPALFATIAATFAFGAFVLSPEYLTSLAESVLAATVSGSNFFFWQGSGYFEIGTQVRPLLHTWSLGVEEQFYLLWPLGLWVTLRRGKTIYFAAVLAVLAISFCAGLAVFDHPSAAFYLLPFRMWEFALGAVLARGKIATPRRWINEIAYAAGTALVVGSAVFLTKDSPYPFYNALAPCCGAALMIFSGNDARIATPFLRQPFIALGRISYSLYLVHWPLVVYYKYLVDRKLGIEDQLILTAMILFAAIVLYFGIEKKFRAARGASALTLRPIAVGVALASIVLIGAPAASAILSDGWNWRYPAEVRALLDKGGNDIAIPHPLEGCFKLKTMDKANIRADCYAPKPGDPRPAIILVGDSTAYALAAGLQQVLGNDYQVLAWTSAACAALYRTKFPNEGTCKHNNTEFFTTLIHQYKYDLVIFSNHRAWQEVAADFHVGAAILDDLKLDYVLLGQMIAYRDIPLSIMARHGAGDLNEVMRQQLAPGCGCDGEDGIDAVVPKSRFFSMKTVLCHDGYPIYTIDGRIAQKDTLHLSDAGAVFVAERLKPWLLENGHLHPRQSQRPPAGVAPN